MKKKNNNTIIITVVIIIIIISLIFYFLINSCKKGKTFFDILELKCKDCAICPNGNYAEKDSCAKLSNTKCMKWNFCKTGEKVIQDATPYNDFKCDEMSPIQCNPGHYIGGIVNLRDGSSRTASCKKCKDCNDDEDEVIECEFNDFYISPYPVTTNGNRFKPLNCTGIYDRICEPKKVIRNKDSILISFKFNDEINNIKINKYLCSSIQRNMKDYINHSDTSVAFVKRLTLQL